MSFHLLKNYLPHDCVRQLDPINYWIEWLSMHRWHTILIAIVGLSLIIFGTRYFKIKQEEIIYKKLFKRSDLKKN
ncbi:hypothetical protein LCGC14_1598030 [marine sediment metagenome]|uniref:Uncharacterized protein n=1 Tax=marine sediment metagenome TaxID=412755 RepID=A0A0F9LCA9_9ZZZZ